MPNRIIRSDLLDSERYHALSSSDAKLLFIELILLADDYGIVPLHPFMLSRKTGSCAGKSPEAITRLLSELADHDLIRCYRDKARDFAFIPRFGNRPQAVKPKHPLPPAGLDQGEIEAAMGRSKWAAHRARLTTAEDEAATKNQQLSAEQPGSNRLQSIADEVAAEADEVVGYKTDKEASAEENQQLGAKQSPETETETEVIPVSDVQKASPSSHPRRRRSPTTRLASTIEQVDDSPPEPGLPKVPVGEIVNAYHDTLPELPSVRVMDDKRVQAIRQTWRWVLTSKLPDGSPRAKTADEAKAWFHRYFGAVRDSDWLMGRTARSEAHRNWRPDIEFLCSPRGLKAVIERATH